MQATANLKLSILTPTLASRLGKSQALFDELQRQIGDKPVEHLGLLNNRKSTVGKVRDTLLRAAQGDYVAFVDDDDWVMPDYVDSILAAMETNPDVISFRQLAIVNGVQGEVEFKMTNKNTAWQPGVLTPRKPWHICAWRRTIAILSHFPNGNYAEDLAFCVPLWKLPNIRDVHIPRVLHEYRFSSATTTCPPDAPYVELPP
jgi:glycosyltransferase involved in cell wall biosynthesis